MLPAITKPSLTPGPPESAGVSSEGIRRAEEYVQRAVSLHIYSRPYDRCLSYCRDTDTFKEVQLHYTSIGGKLLAGCQL